MPPGKLALGRALDAHLTRIDGYLGRIMQEMQPNDVVLVVSDHGYGENLERAPIERTYGEFIKPPHWHTKSGIIAAMGGPVRPGVEIEGASILDVTPTILALLGLPIADDMDGKPLVEVLQVRRQSLRWGIGGKLSRLGT